MTPRVYWFKWKVLTLIVWFAAWISPVGPEGMEKSYCSSMCLCSRMRLDRNNAVLVIDYWHMRRRRSHPVNTIVIVLVCVAFRFWMAERLFFFLIIVYDIGLEICRDEDCCLTCRAHSAVFSEFCYSKCISIFDKCVINILFLDIATTHYCYIIIVCVIYPYKSFQL